MAAMFLCSNQDYLAVLDERLVSQQPLSAIEKQTFGFDHQEVGAELLKMWAYPNPCMSRSVITTKPQVFRDNSRSSAASFRFRTVWQRFITARVRSKMSAR